MLSKKWVGHQSQQCKVNVILAGNLSLLSSTVLCLTSFCAYRLYEIGPRSLTITNVGRVFQRHGFRKPVLFYFLSFCFLILQDIDDDDSDSNSFSSHQTKGSTYTQRGAIRKAGWLQCKSLLVQKKKKVERSTHRKWKEYWGTWKNKKKHQCLIMLI